MGTGLRGVEGVVGMEVGAEMGGVEGREELALLAKEEMAGPLRLAEGFRFVGVPLLLEALLIAVVYEGQVDQRGARGFESQQEPDF